MTTLRRFGIASSLALAVLAHTTVTSAQEPTLNGHGKKDEKQHEKKDEKNKEDHWYDRIHIRGYTQFRYTPYGSNDQLKTPHDKSVGDDGAFLIRRARLIFHGEVAPFLNIYLQPDFAVSLNDFAYVAQLRDWYADVFLDKKHELRIRAGQSKVPYGFENMQSSSNRIPLDRTDALNTAVPDERDIGAFFYFAPEAVRKRIKHLTDKLKGSGDYGMVAFGVYNGQGINRLDRNDFHHFVSRIAYPFQIGSQTIELATAAYAGLFRVNKGEGIGGADNVQDMRAQLQFVLFPQPFGLQLEYNVGRGPELEGKVVREKPLQGGYAMAMLKIGDFMPYVRAYHYEGGRKAEQNSPRQVVKDIEAGVEWQATKNVELTAAFGAMSRKVDGKEQEGKLVRLQLQFSY